MERRFTLRLPDDLAEEIDSFIENSGMTATEFVRRACREKLDREKNGVPEVQILRAEFGERIEQLEKEVESLKKFIEALSVE